MILSKILKFIWGRLGRDFTYIWKAEILGKIFESNESLFVVGYEVFENVTADKEFQVSVSISNWKQKQGNYDFTVQYVYKAIPRIGILGDE